ncbi:AAA family ATPase [Myroides odoratimimus]|uniref:AAA family ATPase n=1 Tax=Myroides odoratimimus TaxID=76832 RepID=UPI0025791230|nr:AAA family ATPase [Myroides odoratimimus]MDM1398615.1 AAA family ATPase [Myroides odoratimimus]
MSFKLLAIRPLKGCSNDVLKNLEEDKFYFFDNSFEQYEDSDYIVKKEDITDLHNDFFLQKNTESSLEYINVQAIVGMNGSGKSSIVEFLLRMLNNFFWFNSKKIGDDDSKKLNLIRAKGINGSLFFLYQGKINVITLMSDAFPIDITWYDLDTLRNVVLEQKNVLSQKIRKRNLKSKGYDKLHNIFFTMYVNYSLYGLDELDFMKEGRGKDEEGNSISWLSRIFHKNDGYQTPLVIHPYREDAMINVRNEKYLMNQRLASLLFTNEKYRDSILGHLINRIKIEKKNNCLSDIVNRLKVGKGKDILHTIFSFNDLNECVKDGTINKYVDLVYFYLKSNEAFFNKIRDQYFFEESKKESKSMTDIQICILGVFLYKSPKEVQEEVYRQKQKINDLSSKDSSQNYKQEDILDMIDGMPLDEELQKISLEKFNESSDTSEWFIKLKEIYNLISYLSYEELLKLIEYATIYKFWLNKFESTSNIENNKFRMELLWYLVKKSLSITRYKKMTYQPLKVSIKELLNLSKEELFELNKSLLDYLNKVYFEKSHITLKLIQCYELLKFTISNPNSEIEKKYLRVFEETNVEYDISELGEELLDLAKNNEIELINVLPPSIFKYDFILIKKDDENINNAKKDIEIHKMSSGQYQKLGLLSSIVYHLRNLDSVKEEKKKGKVVYSKFENVNIILDEIELYFHPEQQRTFINDLLVFLKKNEFKQIKNINLMFITHSPFILSDIPSQSILMLEDGVPVKGDMVNSFGANIHDLLADEFFLKNNGFMGEFAKEKINSLIKFLQVKILRNRKANSTNDKEKKNLNEEIKTIGEIVEYKKDTCKQIISQVGEPILKISLENLYKEAFSTDTKIEDIDEEIIRLQERKKELLNKN